MAGVLRPVPPHLGQVAELVKLDWHLQLAVRGPVQHPRWQVAECQPVLPIKGCLAQLVDVLPPQLPRLPHNELSIFIIMTAAGEYHTLLDTCKSDWLSSCAFLLLLALHGN